jgi:hypothetical protein
MLARLAAQRNRQRRNAEQEALGRRGDGPRIDRVVAHVGANIDSRNHHVRQPVEHAGDGQMHAVGRRAVDVVETIGRALQRQGPIQGQRIARPATVAFGSHNGDFRDVRQHPCQVLDPGCEITIIIAEQDPHNYNRLGTSLNTSDRNAGVQDLTRVGFLAHRQSRCREMSQLFEIFA